MALNIPYKVKRLILMAVIHDVLHIKLALYVYHPARWHILGLATMEIKIKFTHKKSLFWDLLLWCYLIRFLSDIKDRDYKFNPKAIMVSENGARYCEMKQGFGVNFITSKVVSCQMHYRNDAKRVSFRIGPSYRDLFKSICYGMCPIASIAEYNKQKHWMDDITNIFPDISQRVTWWVVRKYHISCF